MNLSVKASWMLVTLSNNAHRSSDWKLATQSHYTLSLFVWILYILTCYHITWHIITTLYNIYLHWCCCCCCVSDFVVSQRRFKCVCLYLYFHFQIEQMIMSTLRIDYMQCCKSPKTCFDCRFFLNSPISISILHIKDISSPFQRNHSYL